MSNSNALNRKLEESISVGKEFEPIAGLWGQFTNVMQRAGFPELDPAALAGTRVAAAPTGAVASPAGGDGTPMETGAEGVDGGADLLAQSEGRRSRGATDDDPLKKSFGAGDLLGTDEGLPPGVAPGGGTVYGRGQ